MITWLEDRDARIVDDDVVARGAAHPMRMVTRAAAAEVGAWDARLRGEVQQSFDALAEEWHTRHDPQALTAVGDALARGGPLPDHGTWLELGSGDGWATETLAARAPSLVALDLSWQMLRRAPADAAPRVMADASQLPLDDHAITAAALVNMLLFPTELDRVLAPGGVLVWISSRGEATPIHLTPEQVAAAMPGRWGGVAARCDTAIWTVLRRLG